MKLYSNRHIPPDEPIDLLNIAFENPRKIRVQVDGNVGGNNKALRNVRRKEGPVPGRYDPDYLVPDRSAGLSELEELRKLCPGRQWNFVSSLFVCLLLSRLRNARSRSTCHTQNIRLLSLL